MIPLSRSYKKSPICTEHGKKNNRSNSPSIKKFANKHIRHIKNLPSAPAAYKRFFESYDICDYKFIKTREDAIAEWEKEEVDFPRYERHYRRTNEVDENGHPIWETYELYVEQGHLHKEYGTLENYLNKYWAKWYRRK